MTYLYPVPESPPDEGTFILVGFNVDWLPFILGVLLPLKNPELWEAPPSDISDQVSELISLLQTVPLFTFWTQEIPETINSPDGSAVETGILFSTSIAGNIVGLRFYKGDENTGTHTGYVYDSEAAQLGSLTFTDESASGWQEAYFDEPIPINACDTYVASYHSPNGMYSKTANFFTTSFDNPPLYSPISGTIGIFEGNGVYRYGDGGVCPVQSYENTNYWCDVIFEPTGSDFITNT